jgi:hypothetical protein
VQIRLPQHRPFVHRKTGLWRSLLTLALVVAPFVAAMAIWPSARLAVSAYEVSGFVTLLAFMGIVLALATALGVAVVKLLAEDET